MDLGLFTAGISSGALLATAAGLYILSVTAFLILESRNPQSTIARLFVLWLFAAGGLSFAAVATAALVRGDRPASFLPAVQSALPEPLERYLAAVVRPSRSERTQLMAGAPITKFLESDPSREVAVFGAVWIKASPARYVEAIKNIENFERGRAFRVTKRISSPPRLEDFAQLTLPDDDVSDLQNCRVGDCKIKLSEQALRKLRAQVDWKSPTARADAQTALRRLALEYVNGYREGGNARLAVYRDDARPTFVADEFRSLIERMPALATGLPDMRRYLLEYPAASLPGSTEFLYWQETEFGLKPTIRISHVVIQERPELTVVASKMLYASHYFWTALEMRVLVPDPARGPGFWFVMVNRSRSDGLSGFLGRIVRNRVRSEVQKGTSAALAATKAALETVAR
jgi:hypothetical protein